MDAFEKVVAIITMVLLMYIVPLFFIMQHTDSIIQSYVTKKTDEFVEVVRNNGYMSETMYRNYMKQLSSTNLVYDIQMIHEHCTYEPVFDEITNTFKNEIVPVYYKTYQEDILEELESDKSTYYFSEGDYFSITLYNKTITLSGMMQRMLFGTTVSEKQIFVTDGGRIRDENY